MSKQHRNPKQGKELQPRSGAHCTPELETEKLPSRGTCWGSHKESPQPRARGRIPRGSKSLIVQQKTHM